ncbi:hypothetical protein NUSPORA_00005 [Nucleospora cyclopteri]
MNENEIFSLTHTFKYKGKQDIFTMRFYKDHFIITNQKIEERIEYSSIQKIKFSQKNLKIRLENDVFIKVPTTIKEKHAINAIFATKEINKEHKNSLGSAFVEFGNEYFYININTYMLIDFKLSFIKKISAYFLPAIKNEQCNLEDFRKFRLFAINFDKKVLIQTEDDFTACCKFNNNKIHFVIENNNE